jgi:hypothetical protein
MSDGFEFDISTKTNKNLCFGDTTSHSNHKRFDSHLIFRVKINEAPDDPSILNKSVGIKEIESTLILKNI